MKFKVNTSATLYTLEQAQKLKTLGFLFSAHERDKSQYPCTKINNHVEVEICTLEELIEFSKKFGEIIVSDGVIDIYDYYRE